MFFGSFLRVFLRGFAPSRSHWVLTTVITATTSFAAVTVTPHTDRPGRPIPADFLGLSIETQSILPGADGSIRYRPDNKPLVALFKSIGLKSLRVGGNTVDEPKYPVADDATVDGLFRFAKAADARVIYSYKLKDATDFKEAARQSKYIHDQYPDQLDAIAIGNEPDFFPKTPYEKYYAAWRTAAAAIHDADPAIRLTGPAAGGNSGQWTKRFSANLHGSPLPISSVCQHYYFGGNSRTIKDPAVARDFLMSDKIIGKYQAEYDKWVPAVLKDGMAYRLEETNSCYNGGAVDVSDTMASALWVLTYLHWWAAHDCGGINLHSGDRTGSGLDFKFSSNYALFWQSDHGYAAKPIAYGAKAFSAGSKGKIIPVDVSDSRLRGYAVVREDKAVVVTLINTTAEEVAVTIPVGDFKAATVSLLTSPKHDAAEKLGVTFAGGEIGEDGSYTPSPTTASATDGSFVFTVPAISAAVVEMSVK